MTTDRARVAELLDSLGVLYVSDKTSIVFGRTTGFRDSYPECDKIDGYIGFFTEFSFDDEGKFITVGAWE